MVVLYLANKCADSRTQRTISAFIFLSSLMPIFITNPFESSRHIWTAAHKLSFQSCWDQLLAELVTWPSYSNFMALAAFVSGVTVNKRELKDPASPTRHHGLPSLKSSGGCWEPGFLITAASLCLQTSVRSSAKASRDALLRLEVVGLPLLRWQTLVQWRGHPQGLIFDLWPAAGWYLRACLGS